MMNSNLNLAKLPECVCEMRYIDSALLTPARNTSVFCAPERWRRFLLPFRSTLPTNRESATVMVATMF